MQTLVTNLETGSTNEADTLNLPDPQVANRMSTLFTDYQKARQSKEETWKEAWAAYLGSPDALEYVRSKVAKLVGDVNDDWRHRINVGKAFEIIETVNGYLQGAFFPNNDWFDLIPHEPGLQDEVMVVKKYMQAKLKDSQFRSFWEMYTRQLLITGFSVLALPWTRSMKEVRKRKKTKQYVTNELNELVETTAYVPTKELKAVYNNLKFEVLDNFDVYIDPLATNPNDANIFRIIRKTKGEVMRNITSGMYPLLDPVHVAKTKGISTAESNKRQMSNWAGIDYDPSDLVELHEFWGNLEVNGKEYVDIVATMVNGHLARLEENPFWCGKPFIVGTCIPLPNKPYGLGVLEPVLGMLHQLNIVTNQRLDNLEIAIDSMWTVVNDGVTDVDDVYTRPGKVIEVGAHDSVRPVQKDTTFTVSYTEAQTLEQNIDQAVGTGAYIGTQQGRSGERVTATEIQAVRDAGGNRLSSIHGHMEQTQLLQVLLKMYTSMQQFIEADDMVRVPGKEPRSYEYVLVGQEELQHEYDIEPVGAAHVADKERDLQRMLDYISLVAQFPQWQESINWEELLRQATRAFGFDSEVQEIILQQKPEEQQPSVQDGTQALLDKAKTFGGMPLEQMLKAQMATQGTGAVGMSMQAAMSGANPTAAAQLGAEYDMASMPPPQ